MTGRTYPADPSFAGLGLLLTWLGAHYARSTSVVEAAPAAGLLHATASLGRKWTTAITLVDTVTPEATPAWEATRAAVEERLDSDGRSILLWVPRGAHLPAGEPGLSDVIAAVGEAKAAADGRLEVRRPVNLYLRRVSTEGSVVTVLGGLQPHWARFTNRVPGSFQLQSADLYRLPPAEEEREELFDRIVLAAGQPQADESQVIPAEDAWTASDLGEGGSCVMGSPQTESDEQSSSLRRALRRLLRQAAEQPSADSDARILALLGVATYSDQEKLSWALRGMDPALYAGYDVIVVITDGVVKVVLEPPRGTLPWDAPLG